MQNIYESPYGNVAYWVQGNHPQALVMVHGTPFSSVVWRRLAPLLATQYTVYTYDLIGYGQSEKYAEQDVSLGAQSALLHQLINEVWQLERPTIVGHDFGGATVLRTHLLHNVDFQQIVLMDAVSLRPWGSPFVQHVLKYTEAFYGMPSYLHEGLLRAYLQDASHTTLDEETLQAYMQPWLGEVGQPAFYRQISQMDMKYTDEVEPLYGNIDTPTTIIWGKEDTWLPLTQGKTLHQRIPNSSFYPVDDAAHLIQEDTPQALENIIVEVLM